MPHVTSGQSVSVADHILSLLSRVSSREPFHTDASLPFIILTEKKQAESHMILTLSAKWNQTWTICVTLHLSSTMAGEPELLHFISVSCALQQEDAACSRLFSDQLKCCFLLCIFKINLITRTKGCVFASNTSLIHLVIVMYSEEVPLDLFLFVFLYCFLKPLFHKL